MGDVVTLVEKAQEVIDEKEALALQKKMEKETLILEDWLEQLQAVKKMGSLKSMLNMIPGLAGEINEEDINRAEMKSQEAILSSMTRKERAIPKGPHCPWFGDFRSGSRAAHQEIRKNAGNDEKDGKGRQRRELYAAGLQVNQELGNIKHGLSLIKRMNTDSLQKLSALSVFLFFRQWPRVSR